MPIKYSLSPRTVVPGDPDSPKKIFASAQYNELVDLNTFARHIQEHGSPFTRDVIIGVLTAAVDCLREQLLEGNKVSFGDLGSFYVTLRSAGVKNAIDFDPRAHIKSVGVNWEPSVYFDDLKNDPNIKWEFTITRKEMTEAKHASKEEANEAIKPPYTDGGLE